MNNEEKFERITDLKELGNCFFFFFLIKQQKSHQKEENRKNSHKNG